jgi:hypothetical protein
MILSLASLGPEIFKEGVEGRLPRGFGIQTPSLCLASLFIHRTPSRREHAKSWGASKFLNAKLRAFGKETALWGSWFGG